MRCCLERERDLAAWTPPVQPVRRPAVLLRLRVALGVAAIIGAAAACCAQVQTTGARRDPGVTHIRVTRQVILGGVTRLGVNLGEQNFYDSGQMLKNLLARNPEFAPMIYRSIFHCEWGGEGRCVDERTGIRFAPDFWNGASYEVLEGAAAGQRGMVKASGAGIGGYVLSIEATGDARASRLAPKTGWSRKNKSQTIPLRGGGRRCAEARGSRQSIPIFRRGRRFIRRCASRLRERGSRQR